MFPLSVSGRKLLTSSGHPFLLNGEAAWSGLVQLDETEWQTYIKSRQSKGVNTILINLIEHHFSSQTPAYENQYAESPFSTASDFSTYNDDYFTRCYDFISALNNAGMLAVVCPCYLGYNGGTQGWWSEISGQTTTDMQDYGEYLGTKFSGLPNILWSMGGDWNGTAAALTRQDYIAIGLDTTGRADWIYTYHGSPGSDSYDVLGTGYSWLSLNAAYNQDMTLLCNDLQLAYSHSSLPMILFESRYRNEGSPLISRLELRSQAYWSILTGGCGAIYGDNPIWHFDTPTAKTPYTWSTGWASSLNTDEIADRQRFKNYFSSIDWANLVPDTSNTILTAGHGSGSDEAVCAALADNSLAVIYTPSQKDLTFDGSQFGGLVFSRYFNPSTGAYTEWRKFAPAAGRVINQPSSGDWIIELRKQ